MGGSKLQIWRTLFRCTISAIFRLPIGQLAQLTNRKSKFFRLSYKARSKKCQCKRTFTRITRMHKNKSISESYFFLILLKSGVAIIHLWLICWLFKLFGTKNQNGSFWGGRESGLHGNKDRALICQSEEKINRYSVITTENWFDVSRLHSWQKTAVISPFVTAGKICIGYREAGISRHNGGLFKRIPLHTIVLWCSRGFKRALIGPPWCRETPASRTSARLMTIVFPVPAL